MFLKLLLAHFIADFPCQIPWFIEMKGKSHEVMLYHCAVYASVICLIVGLNVSMFCYLVGTHFIIDNLKARWGIVKHIWVDQLLHILILLAISIK